MVIRILCFVSCCTHSKLLHNVFFSDCSYWKKKLLQIATLLNSKILVSGFTRSYRLKQAYQKSKIPIVVEGSELATFRWEWVENNCNVKSAEYALRDHFRPWIAQPLGVQTLHTHALDRNSKMINHEVIDLRFIYGLWCKILLYFICVTKEKIAQETSSWFYPPFDTL